MGKTAIETVNLYKRFPNASHNAVDGVSVKIEEGEIITILGTSGSGKTTLLKMINRLYEATSGDILFYGRKVSELKVEDYRRQIGYVIQQAGLFPHMTVEENVATVPKLLKWDKDRISGRVEELLATVHLDPKIYRKRYPRQLSGGQQQRVGLARAMAANPSIMLMDEPFGAIDAITRQSLQDELLSIQKKYSKTILFVTHDIHEALKLGDRIIVMSKGKVQQFDTPYNILFHPANEFVNRLISSEDVTEKLRVLKAADIMVKDGGSSAGKGAEKVPHDMILSDVMNLFMKKGCDNVAVADDTGDIAGSLSWDGFRKISNL